jgi:hypothetical protein
MMTEEKICEECGDSFMPQRGNEWHRFCSYKCRKAAEPSYVSQRERDSDREREQDASYPDWLKQ